MTETPLLQRIAQQGNLVAARDECYDPDMQLPAYSERVCVCALARSRPRTLSSASLPAMRVSDDSVSREVPGVGDNTCLAQRLAHLPSNKNDGNKTTMRLPVAGRYIGEILERSA
jgi:hypothetical protein